MEHELDGILRMRIFWSLDFEKWLYKHLFLQTSLGIHIKQEVVDKQFAQFRNLRCHHCHSHDIMLPPFALVVHFYRLNPKVANAIYVNFKQKFQQEITGRRHRSQAATMNLL